MPRPRLALAVALVLAVVALAPRAARAQIVDVQSLIGRDVPAGASGKLDASIDWRTGNTRLFHVGGAILGRYRRGAHLVFALARGEYGESAGRDQPLVVGVAKTFAHLRYRWQARPWFATEAFVQGENDRFRRLQTRALVGGGGRVRVAECTAWAIHAGLAIMGEYEHLVDDGLASAGAHGLDARVSSYLVGTYAFNDAVTASETMYVQPKVTDPADVRLLDEAALTAKLNTRIAFRFAFSIAFDSRPPPDTARTDSSAQSGVQITF